MTTREQHFASDNYAGVCQEALDYTDKANQLHEIAYGADRWTEKVCDYMTNDMTL